MNKIRKGDLVAVLAGKDKGKTGKVMRVVKDGERVVVEGVNFHKHHIKPNQQGRESGIVRKEASLHVSNLALVSPSTGKAVRTGFQTVIGANGEQKKVRVAKQTGEQLDAS